MHRIEINLSTRKGEGIVHRALAVFAVFVAFILSAYNLNAYFDGIAHLRHMSELVERLEGRVPPETAFKLKGNNAKDIERNMEVINGYVEKKVFSWTGLLSELEENLPDRVYLLQVSPDFEKSVVNITGMAKSMDDVLMTVNRMESGNFGTVLLTRHSKNKDKSFVFNISAQYGAKH